MFIRLTEDRVIKSDENQYMLCKKKVLTDKNTGNKEVKWIPYQYYTTLASLYRNIPNRMLMESEAIGWTECEQILKDTQDIINKSLS